MYLLPFSCSYFTLRFHYLLLEVPIYFGAAHLRSFTRGWWWTVRSWLLAREGSGLGWSRFSGGRWVGISDWSVRWWSGVTQSARVNSPCFCAQAVGPGSLMSCIYKRMTDRRLPYLVSRPFLFSTKSDKHTVINNASPLSLSCALLECCWWRYPDERAYIFDRTINYVVKSSPEKGAVLLFCCSHQVWHVQEIIRKY